MTDKDSIIADYIIRERGGIPMLINASIEYMNQEEKANIFSKAVMFHINDVFIKDGMFKHCAALLKSNGCNTVMRRKQLTDYVCNFFDGGLSSKNYILVNRASEFVVNEDECHVRHGHGDKTLLLFKMSNTIFIASKNKFVKNSVNLQTIGEVKGAKLPLYLFKDKIMRLAKFGHISIKIPSWAFEKTGVYGYTTEVPQHDII